jgi:glycosyltransferase involved in cell wall biosynthesis
MMADKPFLVVSYSIPNRVSGTPVVIRKFLENFKSDEVVLIGRPTLRKERTQNIRFHYPTLTIPTPPVGFRGERIWRLLSVIFGLVIGLYTIKTYGIKAILTFYRDESSLLTGYLLHKISGLPLYSYFCDLYLENYPKGIYGKLAAWLQPRVFSNSQKIIVLTDAMKDFYKEKYQIDAVVLPHCNNLSVHRIPLEINQTGPIKIGYLGNINVDRIPSLKILCESINENNQYFLTYFSSTSKDYLIQQGLKIINSEIIFIPSDDRLIAEMSNCDVLFLPVINSDEHNERKFQMITGFPTKAIEYLICQKPILVHSKLDYFTAQFFSTNHCGLVIDGGKKELYAALEKIRCDPKLRADLVANAFLVVSSYFSGYVIAENFRKLIFFSEK